MNAKRSLLTSLNESTELSPQSLSSAINLHEKWNKGTAISDQDLQNPSIKRKLAALRDLDNIPFGWTKNQCLQAVATKHGVTKRTLFEWDKRYKKKGIAGLRHTKPYAGEPRQWTPEALAFWISLIVKREHRRIKIKDLYPIFVIEANTREWKIGGLKSAYYWVKIKFTPTLKALQCGGMRALDNIMPPILRDYSDLKPFQILVGDQHRFDRWVIDEESGEIFRPEGYLWQDLRTRTIYGAAVDKKYDAWLIGLALRIGITCYGAFGSIYTDNGRPELSKFLTGILANLRSLGMEWQKTDELISDLADADAELILPYCEQPGTHRKAIVKNAKAKMIEGTFYRLEEIMASVMRLPGQTKKMSDDIHWQDIDHQEAAKLAHQGKLLTSREFALAMYQACDYYNNKKVHRGVLAEWSWKPKPKEVTPHDCLRACYNNDNWRAKFISNEKADLLFLARDSRIINKGQISINNELYMADDLLEMHKQRVDLRFNPMTYAEVHVFQNGKYICTAYPVERSSMIDADLTSRKIAEKRDRRKKFAEEFKKISSIAPDLRNYSSVPQIERAAALIGKERTQRAIENKAANRVMSQAELDAKVAELEILNRMWAR